MRAIMKTTWTSVGIVAFALLLSGCGKEKLERAWSFMPNMHNQESLRAFEPEPISSANIDESSRTGRSMRQPVAGTVPMNLTAYTLGKLSPDAVETVNPLPRTMEILKAGQRAFNIYCIVCHGERGEGNGNIIPDPNNKGFSYSGREYLSPDHQFPQFPINSQNVHDITDGQIFNSITKGRAIMPKYDHIPVEMRWSIVHYLRVLYKSTHATEEEVKEYEAQQVDFVDPSASAVVNEWR
jgi:mono/diheme cytochrome c family protein